MATHQLPGSGKAITLINLKGGVAKTFCAWTIAGVLAERARRVLLIDCDVQGNLTGSFLPELDDQPGVDAFYDPSVEPDAAQLVRRTSFAHVEAIPATARLTRFELPNRDHWEKADLQRGIKNRGHLSACDKRGHRDAIIKELTIFMIHTLGLNGNADTISALSPFLEDRYHGSDTVDAIWLLNSHEPARLESPSCIGIPEGARNGISSSNRCTGRWFPISSIGSCPTRRS